MSTEGTNTEEGAVRGGELLLCGSTSWETIGRRGNDANSVMLSSPTRLKTLMGVPIVYVSSGSSSCHCIALDVDGRCYTWGRNEKGQLGLGDFVSRDLPTLVTALSKYTIVKCAAGKNHSVVVTSDGDSFSFGCNKHGQLGTGSLRNEVETLPVKASIANSTHVACGSDFTVWLSSVSGATILTAGLPQYGQLGHGSDHQYNSKDSSVKIVFEPQPRPKAISSLTEKTIVKVACGNNHTVAVDSNGFVYTWGFGGYGRLGHREQKDEFSPRVVDFFTRHNTLPENAVIAAGSAYSACTAGGGQLYMWGRVKPTGDNWMYPKPVYDLSGWAIHCIDCGDKTTFAGAEKSCISWGVSIYGELGYGPVGPKSSASPKKVDLLEGMEVLSVACGVGHSLIVVETKGFEDRVEKLDVFEGSPKSQEVVPVKGDDSKKSTKEEAPSKEGAQNGDKKRRGRPKKSGDEPASKKARGKAFKKEKDESSESEGEDSDDDGDSSDDSASESEDNEDGVSSSGKARGRGRGRGGAGGRGRGRGSSDDKPVATTTTGKRGRGRPRKT